jgi:hypothetical protein
LLKQNSFQSTGEPVAKAVGAETVPAATFPMLLKKRPFAAWPDGLRQAARQRGRAAASLKAIPLRFPMTVRRSSHVTLHRSYWQTTDIVGDAKCKISHHQTTSNNLVANLVASVAWANVGQKRHAESVS